MNRVSKVKTIAGLLAMGWFEYDPGHIFTHKYRVFSKTDAGRQLLVGKSGALRLVFTGGTIANSISLTGGKVHRAICEVGHPGIRWESPQQAESAYLKLQSDTTT